MKPLLSNKKLKVKNAYPNLVHEDDRNYRSVKMIDRADFLGDVTKK